IEDILPTITTFDENNSKNLFNYLKGRCVGKTREIIHRYGQVSDWETLKQILLYNCGEKSSSVELVDELKTNNDLNFSTTVVNRIALQTFKEHLPEPTKTMIIARNTNTLDKAYKIILEARHQSFTAFGQQRKDPIPNSYSKTNFSDNANNRTSSRPNQYMNNFPNYNRSYNRYNNNMLHYGYDDGYVPRNENNYNNNYTPQNKHNNGYVQTNAGNNYNNNGNRSNRTRMSYQTTNTSSNQPRNLNSQRNLNQQRNGNQTQNYSQSGNYNRSAISNRNKPEPMDIGNANINFRWDPQNNYPI
ncbi:GATA zinc finger domain-containing protein 14, partial [Bactrocera oleae]|uniref:GATA zinc finger domain-containing protein 14 n=1 Tax=Bactrocera oleae TaxID=104688 RepID=UPI00174BF522